MNGYQDLKGPQISLASNATVFKILATNKDIKNYTEIYTEYKINGLHSLNIH